MPYYRICKRVLWVDLGVYYGSTERGALDSMAMELGFDNYGHLCKDGGLPADEVFAHRVVDELSDLSMVAIWDLYYAACRSGDRRVMGLCRLAFAREEWARQKCLAFLADEQYSL